jgi:hypothetical protein
MRGDPRVCCRQWRAALGSGEALLLVDFELQPHWRQEAEPLALTALYCLCGGELRVAVTDRALRAETLCPVAQYDQWVSEHALASVVSGEPLRLLPSFISKPWGQEIWFTGVEERGVCRFGTTGSGSVRGQTPIPWLQAALPGDIAGAAGRDLLLLKILDPVAEPVRGELYFELHEVKREIYVITHVDPRAWPDGIGYIRYGFDPERLTRCGSEARFRADYLAAVAAYERVRRRLDTLPDDVEPAPELLKQERQLRAQMNDFTHLRPLRRGDVVVVPPLLPHSLQHGVRAIEFQTPVYERRILSFSQRAQTQAHWDTSTAVQQMRLAPPPPAPFECLLRAEGVEAERIVDFPDFEVRRITIAQAAGLWLEPLVCYALVMVVEGVLALGGGPLQAEQAALLPAGWEGALAPSGNTERVVLLLALPRG